MLRSGAVRLALLGLLAGPLAVAAADDLKPKTNPELPAAALKPTPENVEDLRAIQKQVRFVLDKVIPATVNVRVGQAQGSGVIISEDGYILTAGHVSGEANKDVVVLLHNGRRVKGTTLGANRGIDSGLIKITDAGKWPALEMGRSADLKKGQWCVTTGHPNGYVPGRPPVVRLGRVLDANDNVVRTDCTLVGGDSGGPLFDLHGRVIGIHSRIGPSLAMNMHVPVDTYRDTWEPLAQGDVWRQVYVGFSSDEGHPSCKIDEVKKDSPAEKGGLKVDDVITKFDGRDIKDFAALRAALRSKKPRDKVDVEVQRGGETVSLKLVLGGK